MRTGTPGFASNLGNRTQFTLCHLDSNPQTQKNKVFGVRYNNTDEKRLQPETPYHRVVLAVVITASFRRVFIRCIETGITVDSPQKNHSGVWRDHVRTKHNLHRETACLHRKDLVNPQLIHIHNMEYISTSLIPCLVQAQTCIA